MGYGYHYIGKRSADAEPEPYRYGSRGYGGGYYGGRGYGGRGRRAADSEPVADAESKPYYYLGYYPYYAGYHYIGKRSTDAQPESNPWYGYGGWGGYGGYYWG